MRLLNQVGLLLSLSISSPLLAQQVKLIDLTTTTQRVQLRYPPVPAFENGFGGGFGVDEWGNPRLSPRLRPPHLVSVVSVLFEYLVEEEHEVVDTKAELSAKLIQSSTLEAPQRHVLHRTGRHVACIVGE